jgi:hypothetical protein
MGHIIDFEPSFHGEATIEKVWLDVMTKEYQSILKNDVWDIVPILEEKFGVTSKRIYKINHAFDGSIEKYKVRLVAKIFPQIEGVIYDETFEPVARYTSIHTIIHELETTSDGCKDNLSQW